MSGILGRTLLAGAVLLTSSALAAAQTSSGAAGTGASGAASPAPAMTSPGPTDPSTVTQPAPTASVGEQVPIHGMSDMSTPLLSNSLESSGRSSATGCPGGESGTAASGTGADSAGCGISLGDGDLHSLSIMNSGSSSAIDVSKP